MTRLAKFGVLLLALPIAGVPLMACMLPGTSLSAEEQACCREMGYQCGHDQTPSSHPCCETVGPTDQNALAKSSFKLIRQFQALYLVHSLMPTAELPQLAVSSCAVLAHAPPEIPAGLPDILRI